MVELSVGSESVRQERQTKWGGGKDTVIVAKLKTRFSPTTFLPRRNIYCINLLLPSYLGKPKYNTMFSEQNLAEDNVSKTVFLNFVNVGPVP